MADELSYLHGFGNDRLHHYRLKLILYNLDVDRDDSEPGMNYLNKLLDPLFHFP